MACSSLFRRSPRLTRFLEFIVARSLNEETWKLKEYSIAVEVFGKPDSFDPRIDSTVRVAARQLRAKLAAYYATDGRHDTILIRLRPGDYTPKIEERLSDTANDDVREVFVVDADRKSAHSIAECLDPSIWRIVAVTNDVDRALTLLQQSDSSVVVAGFSVSSGVTGEELFKAIGQRPGTGMVAVMSSEIASAVLPQVLEFDPDSIVLKPLRQTDLQNAVRVAEIRAARRRAQALAMTGVSS